MSTTKTVSEVQKGDTVLVRARPVKVTYVERLRSGRIRLWGLGQWQSWSRVSAMNIGRFDPSDTIEVP